MLVEIGFQFRPVFENDFSPEVVPRRSLTTDMQTNNTAVVQVLPSAREDQRVEVVLEQRGGEDVVALRHSVWTEGLGWCAQKTIRLDADQLDELHRAVTVARHRVNRRRGEAGQASRTAQVIQLPTLA
jgi:hypothetical protein